MDDNISVQYSILSTIKKMLGITEDYEQFDVDIVIHINTAFAALNQIGAGPKDSYSITDKSNVWSEFETNKIILEPIKSYVYLKTRLVFDPPTSSMVTESIKETLKELEFRIQLSAEKKREEEQNATE